MKKSKELVPSLHKAKKTVQLSVVLPWIIVAVMVSALAGYIGGWVSHSSAMSSVKNEAIQMAKDIKNS